ncbi:hypothetical protein Tco_0422333 [Tanacetum coccineum]
MKTRVKLRARELLEKVSESANVQKPKQADQPRKVSQNPRNNSTNWNTPMSKKLGVGFQFTPKACFVCGSFNHLIKDCDFHDKKMVQKPVLNNVKKGTGQREVRPVWNNAMRTNHQNFSNSRRNFAPTAVLTKSGLVPISTARQNSSRTAATVSAARPIKTDAPKPFVNVAKARPNAFQKSHSPSRRPFYQQTTLKNKNLNNKVNIVKANSVNTAKGKRVTSAVGEQRIDAVNSKACWVWRPKLKVGDEVVHKELGDRMERAVTTASSFKAEQDSDAQTRFEGASKSPKIHLSQEVTHLEFDQERKEADDIDWSKIVKQAQERQSGSMISYQALKKKPVTVAQASCSEPFHQEKSTEEPKELSEEDLKKMLEIVPVEEFRVEALQNKYPIINWENHTEGSRKYWKIIRVGNITEAYQGFKDMLKAFDREDLDTLRSLVKENFRSVEPTKDMVQSMYFQKEQCNLYPTIKGFIPVDNSVMKLFSVRRLQMARDSVWQES